MAHMVPKNGRLEREQRHLLLAGRIVVQLAAVEDVAAAAGGRPSVASTCAWLQVSLLCMEPPRPTFLTLQQASHQPEAAKPLHSQSKPVSSVALRPCPGEGVVSLSICR